jgi:hypothetical protein
LKNLWPASQKSEERQKMLFMNILRCRHFLTLPLKWLKETTDHCESEDKSGLIPYTTGLISQKGNDEANPEECLSNFLWNRSPEGTGWVNSHQQKGKVQNLSLLKKTMKFNDKQVFVDSIKLFQRLVLVSHREITIQ